MTYHPHCRLLLMLCLGAVAAAAAPWHLPCPAPSDKDIAIPIGVFVPFPVGERGQPLRNGSYPEAGELAEHTGYGSGGGSGGQSDYASAIHLALEHIRNHSCLLTGYRINLTFKSTKCSPALGMKALFDIIHTGNKPVAILGGQCTNVNDPIAMALKYWKIVQLSYSETHPKFSSADAKELYPTFFRVVPAYRNSNDAKIQLIKNRNWTRVATIKQSDESRYALPHEELTRKMEDAGLKVIRTAGVTLQELENVGGELDELKKEDAHIIVLDAAQEMATIVMCEAYRRGMNGAGFVWILPGYQTHSWSSFLSNPNVTASTNCTADELHQMLNNHFAVEFARERRRRDERLPHGPTANEVLLELKRRRAAESMWATFLYDGMWTLAMALSESLKSGNSLEDVYEDLMTAMNYTDFQGVTGRVMFRENERRGIIDIKQYTEGAYVEVGKFDGTEENKIAAFTINTELLAKGWSAPLDHTKIIERLEHISTSLAVGFSLLAGVGILLAAFFLIVNIRYRNHRFIKMSSPNLNNIIIVGSIFTYISVILMGIDTRVIARENFEKLCYARSWILCLGFTLAFGSMFSKTWRVHSIFTNIRMDKKAIKDSKLFLMLGVLLLLDVVVLGLWALFSPLQIHQAALPEIITNESVIRSRIETCKSENGNSLAFQIVLFAIKGILMILGCFLAWETRRVNIPALNDSKYIGMSVYVVVVMSVIGLSIAFVLQDRVNEAYALTSLFIIFSTTLTLCLLFVPKLVELARNPQGLEPKGYRRGLMKSVVNKQKTTIPTSSTDDCKDLLARADAENQRRHRLLHERSSKLWELLERLRDLGDTTFMQQEWCFGSSGVVSGPPTTTPDSDPLLGAERKSDYSSSDRAVAFREPSTSSARQRDDWPPWADPDQPSTML